MQRPDPIIPGNPLPASSHIVTQERFIPKDRCLPKLFEAQAVQRPDAIAVWCGEQQVTYWELNERANQVAHYLQQQGVGPEVRVGICLERSVEMVVGLLGILKAGGTYIPLDPIYPSERLRFMLEDSHPLVLLTLQRLRDHLPEGSIPVLYLDADWEMIAQQNKTNPLTPVTPSNIAYIMYTSGSTGRPKGVMVSHHAIANRLLWAQSETPLTPADSVFQLASFSFDISIWELFGPWLAGARVVLVDPVRQFDSTYLINLMFQQQITVAHFVPSLLQILLETPGLETCTSLRWVFCGGEAVPVNLPQRLLERLPIAFYQFYGPTEAAISATWWMYNGDDTLRSLPIGKPIANMHTYVLDSNLQPVPRGIVGELFLGGEGLAYGYLHRPEITAERFVPHPFSKHAGDRLYRTGDLARYLPDNNLEFLGRIDHQVKIRGIRVELGEIETVLNRYPGVGEVVVVVREDRPGDKRLVAYLVGQAHSEEAEQVTAGDLRQHLQARLPEYMLPAAFVWLDTLPLTPNGKVNRQALPPPQWRPEENLLQEQAPQTPIEEMLAEVWAEVLGMRQVSREANFFELGGHSLLAMRLVSRIRRRLQIDVPLRALFEAPTLADLAQLIDQMSREELQRLRPLVRSIAHEGEAPLAYEQEQLWFLAQLEPANPAYNIVLALRLEGPLQAPTLEVSLNALLERHESLRTCFHAADGRPFQVIAHDVTLPLPLLDLSDLAGVPLAQQTAFEQLSQQEADTPFDLEKAPLLRARLVRFDPRHHCLLLTVHHLLFDGLSQGVLSRELGALYSAIQAGTTADLPPMPIQYADYARWQRERLKGEVLASELAYWQGEVAGAPTYLDLSTDHPRSASPGFQGAALPFALPTELTARLKAFARQEGCTLYMLVLAGLEVVLNRYSGQDDFLLGTPMNMRTQVETEGLIGMLVNTLVLRADVKGQPTGRELLQRVRERVLQAQAHPGLPLEKLVEVVHPERQGSATPLVQVAFAWEEAPPPARELGPGLWLRVEPWVSRTAKFELTFFAWEAQEGLTGQVEYNRALYEAASIERLAGHWQQALEGLMAQPERQIGQMRLLTEREWARQVEQWNQTQRDFPRQMCVHELVEAQVVERPQAYAVCWGEQEVTYWQLNERANQLAHYLQQQGVGPEIRVGVCLERSVELIVSVLAVLKAGGAYVPLDPAYPVERLVHILSDAQLQLVLTQPSLRERLPQAEIPVWCLDALEEPLAQQPVTNAVSEVGAMNLAYLMYTSGSTGQPKGIAITHRNIVRLVYKPNYVHVNEADVFLQLAPAAFDAATFEIWGSLVNGARLALAPAELPSLEELSQIILQHQVSVLWLTAGFFHQMVEMHLEGLRPLKQLLAGGEVLSVSHVRQAVDRLPGCQIINGYGPTENTTFSCCYPVQVEDTLEPSVPIGRPIGTTQAYVLDEQLEPVPIGVVGELYLGGEGLARGYLNRPELTAERFVPHPFSAEPGARLYRTGDLVRAQAGGMLLFVGRDDGQIKLRGYRIESEEIESWLSRHPAVQSAVVVLREDRPGDKRLVAYLVGQGPTGQAEWASAGVLRQHLQAHLPEYMIPAAFVWLDILPLTPNGKVDRRALPPPQWEHEEDLQEEPASQTPIEEMLAEMWAEVLGVRQVGRQANFFELGGHSLLATQLISRVRSRFQIDVPLRALFEAPTLAGLADSLPKYETMPGRTEAIARLYIKVNAMSTEELEKVLKDKRKRD
ncbi:MAG: amino acid adenylation domain-containing protein [Ktedonobacteraceae bacterium]